jgi:hypothetical protein
MRACTVASAAAARAGAQSSGAAGDSVGAADFEIEEEEKKTG